MLGGPLPAVEPPRPPQPPRPLRPVAALSAVDPPRPPRPVAALSQGPSALPSRFPLLPAVRLFVLFIAGTAPVLAIPLHVLNVLPLPVAARYAVLPLALAAALIMVGPSVQGAWGVQGFIGGLVAVTVYDMLRLSFAITGVFPDFIPALGGLILDTTSPNLAVGYTWRYIGDGGGIGVAFFVTCGVVWSVWPAVITKSPVWLSIGYGVFIWTGLIMTVVLSRSGPTQLFQLSLSSLAITLAGHLVYGSVLGLWLRQMLSDQVVGAWPGSQPPWLRLSRVGESRQRRSPRRQHLTPAPAPVWVAVSGATKALAGSVNAGGAARSSPTPVGDVESALRVAIDHGDVAQYVNALVTAVVIVPTTAAAPNKVKIGPPSLRWRLGGSPQSPVIEAFTSVEGFERAAPPPAPGDTLRFPDLLAAWPDGGYGLAINPGTPLGLVLRDEQVQMLRRWVPTPLPLR